MYDIQWAMTEIAEKIRVAFTLGALTFANNGNLGFDRWNHITLQMEGQMKSQKYDKSVKKFFTKSCLKKKIHVTIIVVPIHK